MFSAVYDDWPLEERIKTSKQGDKIVCVCEREGEGEGGRGREREGGSGRGREAYVYCTWWLCVFTVLVMSKRAMHPIYISSGGIVQRRLGQLIKKSWILYKR